MNVGVWLCIPLYNEQGRFRVEYLDQLLNIHGLGGVLLVDDGSKDQTLEVLSRAQKQLGDRRVKILSLPSNGGKGEAVRSGLRHIRFTMPHVKRIGFLDADGAVSAADVSALICFSRAHERYEMVWGARVALAGRDIQRSKSRHFVARAFSTLIAFAEPSLPYDTQCGLKIFSATNILDQALANRFATRWLFDIEIFLRMKNFSGAKPSVWEHPLMRWHDIAGSKVAQPLEAGRMLVEVMRIIYIAKNSSRIGSGNRGS